MLTATEGTYNVNFTVPTAPCPNYTITTQTGQSIVPGTADTGNHCDDCTSPVTFPFPVYVYGHSYTSGVVESNGTIQFDGETSVFTNTCLNAAAYGRTFFPYWDDLLHAGLRLRHLHDDDRLGPEPHLLHRVAGAVLPGLAGRPTSRPSSTRTTRC